MVTVPPVEGSELIAAWIAAVSSCLPSPTAPYVLTLRTVLPRAREGGVVSAKAGKETPPMTNGAIMTMELRMNSRRGMPASRTACTSLVSFKVKTPFDVGPEKVGQTPAGQWKEVTLQSRWIGRSHVDVS